MNPLAALAMAFSAGLALGGIHFGGLRLTVGRLSGLKRPGLVFAASLVARTGVSVAVFYFFARQGHLERVLAVLAGFLVMRTVLIRRNESGGGG